MTRRRENDTLSLRAPYVWGGRMISDETAHGSFADVVSDDERLRVRSRPRAVPLMRQRWERLGFLHWAVDPAAVAGLLPPYLEVDTWEGAAYVGLVPFTI